MIFGFKKKETLPQENKLSLFDKLKTGLSKTRDKFSNTLGNLLWGTKKIDADLLEHIETLLLSADVGVKATQKIIDHLTDALSRKTLNDGAAVLEALEAQLAALFPAMQNWPVLSAQKPHLILMVGMNGAGKTTTIAKLTQYFQSQGLSVMLAAGDTFRAAAIDQLQVWGERHDVPVIAQMPGADSAAVIFDAFQSAKAKGIDIVIADTAGRLHTQTHLMEELKKIVRVVKKIDPQAPHDTLLVLDAGIGQNALSQAKLFKEAVGVNGLVITKLDGTAKGGIIFALAEQEKIPVRMIGIGERAEDLRPFDPSLFVQALFAEETPRD